MKPWYESKTIRGLGGVLVGLGLLVLAPQLVAIGVSADVAAILEKVALGILLGGVGVAGYGRAVADGPLISDPPGPRGPGAVGIVLLPLLLLGCSTVGMFGGGQVTAEKQGGDAIQGLELRYEEFYEDGSPALKVACRGSDAAPCRWTGPPSAEEVEATLRVLKGATDAAIGVVDKVVP